MRLTLITLLLTTAGTGVNAFTIPHNNNHQLQHSQVGKYSGHRQHNQWSQRQQFHKREDGEVVLASDVDDTQADDFTTEAHGMHGQSGKIIRRPGNGIHGQQQFHHFQKRELEEEIQSDHHDDIQFDAELEVASDSESGIQSDTGDDGDDEEFSTSDESHHFEKREPRRR
ncbi:hypothetical protein HK102_010949, partial [Quaeritorhiza haematococci]